MAKRKLFNPKKKTNIEITVRMLDIVSVGMPQMKKDLTDMRKSTWRNLYREVNIEFLDESLRMPGKRRVNILMQYIFLLLASPEMAIQSRFVCIVYFVICIPVRWLAGKTHELKDFPVGDPPE